MTTEKTNLMRPYAVFAPEPTKVKEERRVMSQPRSEAETPRSSTVSSTLQPLFTLGRRSRGKALEI